MSTSTVGKHFDAHGCNIEYLDGNVVAVSSERILWCMYDKAEALLAHVCLYAKGYLSSYYQENNTWYVRVTF